MNEQVNDQEILLVTEEGSNDLNVVSGINEDGSPKTVKPSKENEPDFLKIDKNADVLENFFKNFLSQYKDPTHFNFFKVPINAFENMVSVMENMLKDPDNPSNEKFLGEHRVLPEAFAPKAYQAIDESRINWEQLGQLGITKEKLERSGSLEPMLNWQKSPVLVTIKTDALGESIYSDARLSFREDADGNLKLRIHNIRNAPELNYPFMGATFTDEDKKNLRETGNAGRLIEIEPREGMKMQAFISVDKLTNELVALRADRIKLPAEFKGVVLNDEQKKDLAEGKAVFLKDMLSKKGTLFSANIQINADRRGLEIYFGNNQRQSQIQTQEQDRVPKTFRKKELTEDQRASLQEGKTVYVSGLTDRNGKNYNGYITWKPEEGKTDFMFATDYKKALEQGLVKPDDGHKVQVAVNSEGKTTEATKNVKEPLEQGQTTPTEQQKEKQDTQQEQDESQQQSRGRRM
ncbi:DUF3945 domain-containing protein [Dysgonomonas sp. Marseille-P4677]|uniref:DUF3945 domain-containing protein n=1 Tax=Dysgonomonas sp. Marseille-P4677 TaxID=2364790 RepID=UPI0019146131|nr:DUF3945 domain-containing protein [Dysgonomonas sp. Marseille-P4677]MBK5720190.1 DUF3945 domain-containing protein [Dysgonomonas sp. Marseille-P4677]